VVARLAPDVTPAAAEADLDAIARRLQQRHPAENAKKIGISLYPLHTEIVRDYRTMLWTLFGAVGVPLLVGCVNLAILLLVRAAGRDAEFAIRASLGATPLRLARQVLGETVLLAAVGGMAGIVVAYFGLRAWRVWGPADFPQLATTALDWNGCLFAGVMTVGAAITCAAVPAWFASRHAAQRNTDGLRTTTISRAHATVQRALLSAEVAAATVLLVAMLLMARGFARLERVAPGFTPGQTLAIQLNLPPAAYGNRDALTQFFDALRERLRTIPGIESAGAVSLLPLSGFLNTVDIALPDQPTPPPDEVPQAHLRIATSEYFAAAGIQVFRGRAFDDHDNRDGRPVAVVSRTFAERHWPGRSALGKRVQILESSDALSVEVVGVVNDVKQFTLDAGATADLYVPLHQVPAFQAPAVAARMNWVIRARLEPAALIETFRKAVAAVDPGVAASGARTLESVWLTALGPTRASVRLLEAFGYVALVLCAMGVYGVAAFSARARRRELAIRAALGATTSNLTVRMLRQEFVPVLRGLGLGTFVALAAAPVLFNGAYATNPRDAVTYAQVAMLLLTVALMAISLPIRAAGRTNPSDALSA
jgi:predicted permease